MSEAFLGGGFVLGGGEVLAVESFEGGVAELFWVAKTFQVVESFCVAKSF